MDGRQSLLKYANTQRTAQATRSHSSGRMRPTLNNDAAGHPKTGPRRTLRAAKDLKDLVPQRRYPVLGWPRCCLRNEFVQCSMTNLLNLTRTTAVHFPKSPDIGLSV